MARLAPTPLQLAETEREQLQQLVNRHSTPQQIALHLPALFCWQMKGRIIEKSLVISISVEIWQGCGAIGG